MTTRQCQLKRWREPLTMAFTVARYTRCEVATSTWKFAQMRVAAMFQWVALQVNSRSSPPTVRPPLQSPVSIFDRRQLQKVAQFAIFRPVRQPFSGIRPGTEMSATTVATTTNAVQCAFGSISETEFFFRKRWQNTETRKLATKVGTCVENAAGVHHHWNFNARTEETNISRPNLIWSVDWWLVNIQGGPKSISPYRMISVYRMLIR